MRKTVNVKELLTYANIQLARTDEHITYEFKAGVATMIEVVLRNAKQYNGFMYLGDHDSESNDFYSRRYYMKKED